MINSLKKSLDHILHDDYKQKAGMPVNCDVPNRGRKHFYEHRSLNDNVSLSFRPYYDSSRDRVEKIIDVYSRGNCNGSLKYNVENSQQIRFTKGSPDNIMSRKFVASGEYVVMKFNKVQSLSPKLKFKINK